VRNSAAADRLNDPVCANESRCRSWTRVMAVDLGACFVRRTHRNAKNNELDFELIDSYIDLAFQPWPSRQPIQEFPCSSSTSFGRWH
jgi:hypothetical protein